MRTSSIIIIFFLQSLARSEYLPGTPGGSWSQEDLLVVRAKLWRLYSHSTGIKSWWKKGKITNDLPEPSFSPDLGFFAAKVVRLSFHDCLRYADGSGGCDGCLNWAGVGTRFSVDSLKYAFKEDDVHETNNNGLEYTVAVLEKLYTNPNFPPGAPKLSESLRSSGKSRADFWSYAAKVAVEFAVEQNNFQCEDKPAHTLGRMNPSHSLLKYVWTVRGGHMFNNAYYKNFVRTTDWFIQSYDDHTCTLLGDATGTLPDVKWVPTMNGFTKSGGPMHWIRMNFACPYCEKRNDDSIFMAQEYDRCCPGRQEGHACQSDNATRNFEDDITGCEKYRFAFGLDEMAMNAEMGLYLQFDVENGIPKNCPGFEQFNMEHWEQNPRKDTLRRAYNQECPLNMRSLPEDDLPVSTIIADYASDQDLWLRDFTEAFEKMMANGYEDSVLTKAPNSWENVYCRMEKGIVCNVN